METFLRIYILATFCKSFTLLFVLSEKKMLGGLNFEFKVTMFVCLFVLLNKKKYIKLHLIRNSF